MNLATTDYLRRLKSEGRGSERKKRWDWRKRRYKGGAKYRMAVARVNCSEDWLSLLFFTPYADTSGASTDTHTHTGTAERVLENLFGCEEIHLSPTGFLPPESTSLSIHQQALLTAVWMAAGVFVCVNACACVCVCCAFVCVNLCTRMCVCMWMHVCAVCVNVNACVCVCVCVFTWEYVCDVSGLGVSHLTPPF